jgi:cytochrome c biogenesis factor
MGEDERSMVLWLSILAPWTVAVNVFSDGMPALLFAGVVGIMGLVSADFLPFVRTASNPFRRASAAMTDGGPLNPQLQRPERIFRPLLLRGGYVGLSMAFANASAALLGGLWDSIRVKIHLVPVSLLGGKLLRIPAPRWGMFVAYVRFALVIAGIAMSKLFIAQAHVRVGPADRVELLGYALALTELRGAAAERLGFQHA